MAALCSSCETFKEKLKSRTDSTLPRKYTWSWKNIVKETNNLLLHHAVLENHLDCVPVILELGEDINELSTVTRYSALMIAVMKGHVKMAELLLKHGADVNICDKHQRNALWYAAYFAHMRCMKMLVNAGSISSKNSALFAAAQPWNLKVLDKKTGAECMQFLLDNGEKFGENDTLTSHLFWCITTKDNRQLLQYVLDRYILKKGLNIPDLDYNGAFHAAIENECDIALEVLLENKEKLDIKINAVRMPDPRTALQKACFHGLLKMVELLLAHGADTDRVNSGVNNMGILYFTKPPVFVVLRGLSYRSEGLYMLAALIKHGCDLEQKADVNLRDASDDVPVTALDYAVYGGNLYAARMLVLGGARNYNPTYSMMKPHKKLVHKRLKCTTEEKDAFIDKELYQPRSLYIISRAAVRKFIPGNPADVNAKITLLPLPKSVQKFLAYRDLDKIAKEYDSKMNKQKWRTDFSSDSSDSSSVPRQKNFVGFKEDTDDESMRWSSGTGCNSETPDDSEEDETEAEDESDAESTEDSFSDISSDSYDNFDKEEVDTESTTSFSGIDSEGVNKPKENIPSTDFCRFSEFEDSSNDDDDEETTEDSEEDEEGVEEETEEEEEFYGYYMHDRCDSDNDREFSSYPF